MELKIVFQSQNNIVLPTHYNHILQGFIYNNINDELAQFLHDKGYILESRKFKLFTYSNILTKGQLRNSKLYFGKKAEWVVKSPIKEFINSFGNYLLQKDQFLLGNNIISVEKTQLKKEKVDNQELIVKTLSPIVAYSTFLKENGSKYTCYFSPNENDFQRIIRDNIIKKYAAFYGELEEDVDFSIKAISNTNLNIVYYKDFLIKGYSGKFKLTGDKRLLELALDAGVGSKNSQGFGCIQQI
ncbi:MAG: CRISPR-associated endoribonuclease Cas6 [Tissierellales bacterium]|nr:CRISPR-associated endoribonuclease Cas6 [Tissierellales bacterium]